MHSVANLLGSRLSLLSDIAAQPRLKVLRHQHCFSWQNAGVRGWTVSLQCASIMTSPTTMNIMELCWMTMKVSSCTFPFCGQNCCTCFSFQDCTLGIMSTLVHQSHCPFCCEYFATTAFQLLTLHLWFCSACMSVQQSACSGHTG